MIQKKKKSRKTVLLSVVFGFIFLLAAAVFIGCYWVNITYGVKLNELIYTLTSNLKGVGSTTVNLIIEACLPKFLFAVGIYTIPAVIICVLSKIEERRGGKRSVFLKICKCVGAILCSASLVLSLWYVERSLNVINYVSLRMQSTEIYDDYYVNPLSLKITQDGPKKNVIMVYLESMETTYASVSEGGKQKTNYIPNLTRLAKENISFSNTDKFGGMISANGTNWTMGALFASTSGLPFSFPVGGNDMDKQKNFASGVTALGDILKRFGYTQEFLCGSDADFAGRRKYFEQHGNFNIFDIYTARQRKYIPNDYYAWWGFEDLRLYEIAKDEITSLAKSNRPFNFTMLTADTHHVRGYICKQCRKKYSEPLANVLECTDRQLNDFISWCKGQDFYEDTVIVVVGDHPRMDTYLVDGADFYERTLYNCFINADTKGEVSTENRLSTPMDIYPTVLSAMGFTIPGDRLGIGTNLFSKRKTLPEELGIKNFDSEISKYSPYFVENFS